MLEALEDGPATSPIVASQAYAVANDGVAAWQVLSTLAMLLGLLAATRYLGPYGWAAIPLLGGLIVRVFVLQHDCGHRSLFAGRRTNDGVGLALSFITGVPFHIWRVEHNWHHANQGKLDRRGVDAFFSGMTLAEARQQPDRARQYARLIKPFTTFFGTAYSIIWAQRRFGGFIFSRPTFRWPIPDKPALLRSVLLGNAGFLAWLVLLGAWLGPWKILTLFLPALVIGAGIGGLMFWTQHNFERTYQAWDDAWDYTRMSLQGSSYLELPAVLSWFTCGIGLHHVHHLNVRIPNYRLEAARRGIPELAAVAPLTWREIRGSYSYLFWDEEGQRLVPLATALEPPTP